MNNRIIEILAALCAEVGCKVTLHGDDCFTVGPGPGPGPKGKLKWTEIEGGGEDEPEGGRPWSPSQPWGGAGVGQTTRRLLVWEPISPRSLGEWCAVTMTGLLIVTDEAADGWRVKSLPGGLDHTEMARRFSHRDACTDYAERLYFAREAKAKWYEKQAERYERGPQ